ncbi:MAG: HD domain-containing protein [Anaerolineales bacterium]|jgi:uncharacterized protein
MPIIEEARQWYPTADPVHGFDHVLRVYHLAERLARTEGADLEIVLAAVLLHDAQGNSSHQAVARQDHQRASAEFAGQILQAEGWPEPRVAAVQHCIRAHRFRDEREQPTTLEAQVLFDADKLDAIGAIGVARAVAFAALAGQPAYATPSPRFLESGQLAPGEPHSAYHEFLFKLRKLKDRLYTPAARAIAVERHTAMAEFFERLGEEVQGQL